MTKRLRTVGGGKPAAEIVEIKNSPEVRLRAKTDLHRAVERMNIGAAKDLLEKGEIDPGAQDEYGDTIAHLAIKRGDDEMLAMLLRTPGIDWTIPNDDGFPPLHLAAELNLVRSVAMIVSYCEEGKRNIIGKVRSRETGDSKALHEAQYRIENILNGHDAFGRNALHIAAIKSHPEVAAVLVDSNLNLEDKDSVGRTALAIAEAISAGGRVARDIHAEAEDDDVPEVSGLAIARLPDGRVNHFSTYNTIRRAMVFKKSEGTPSAEVEPVSGAAAGAAARGGHGGGRE